MAVVGRCEDVGGVGGDGVDGRVVSLIDKKINR